MAAASLRRLAGLLVPAILLAGCTWEVAPASAPAPPAARQEHPGKPASGWRIRIPAIGVDAQVGKVGLTADRELEVPRSPDRAGLYTGGAAPGAEGPTIVVGHVDSRSGPAVFSRLFELRPNASITLRAGGGTSVRYRVRKVRRYAKADFPTEAVYGPTGRPELRLITCGGSYDKRHGGYRDNVVVFASLAGRP